MKQAIKEFPVITGSTIHAYMDLKALPETHPLRNTALRFLRVELKPRESRTWRKVEPGWKIGRNTFNELGPTWTDCEWRVECGD